MTGLYLPRPAQTIGRNGINHAVATTSGVATQNVRTAIQVYAAPTAVVWLP